MGAGQSFELHLKGQRVCEHAERGFGGEKNLGRDSMDKTLKWARLVQSLGPGTRKRVLTRQNMKLERLAKICSESFRG